jgi:hypothetical protein
MMNYLHLPLVVLSLLASPCLIASGQEEDSKAHSDLEVKLIGSWKIVSASFDGKPSELHKTSITIKHITPVQLIWIGYHPEDRRIFRAAGGTWKAVDGKYVETMRYGLDEKFKEQSFGKTLAFECIFKDDLWIQRGTLPNGILLEETWQRIKPDEDVDRLPQ